MTVGHSMSATGDDAPSMHSVRRWLTPVRQVSAVHLLETAWIVALVVAAPAADQQRLMFVAAGLGAAVFFSARRGPVFRLSALDGIAALTIGGMIGLLLALLVGGIDSSTGLVAVLAGPALALGGILLIRASGYGLIRSLRRRGWLSAPAVAFGAADAIQRLTVAAAEHPETGVRVSVASQPPVDADAMVAEAISQEASIAFLTADVPAGAARELRAAGVIPFYVPDARTVSAYDAVGHDSVWGVSVVPLRSGGWIQAAVKRLIDLAFAATALLLLLPALLLIGAVIRRETGGAVLFRQERIGRGGKPFNLLKFQTMVPVNDAESQTRWNVSTDDRIGPFGRFLRRSSADELPQLLNILRGDMSLVGPRPERPHFVAQFSEQYPHYPDRHRVPVGLTGWAQVHRYRGDTSIDERAHLDNHYADNWSLVMDLKVLCLTIPEVFRRSGG